MPHNKKHHYVPRFYLKRFSLDSRSICLWNINRKRLASKAKLKNQCYKDYFYGKELTIEKALGTVEGHASRILKQIDKFQVQPRIGSEEHLMLVLYILMQSGRTAYTADAFDEIIDKMMKYLFEPKAKQEGIDLSKVTIGIKDPANFSLGSIAKFYPLLLDLNCKLLQNETSVDFITSDNPVVLYNQLFMFRKHGSNTGLTSKGLQVFFPISSRLLLLFYDYESYTVGSRSKAIIKINLPRDVYELNTLQMTSAYENIYFKSANFDVDALYKKAFSFRRTQKSKMSVFPEEETKDTRKELIFTSREDVRTNLKLSFVKVTKKTKEWRNRFQKSRMQPAVVVRNKELVDSHDAFMKKVDNGEYNSSDFFKYLADKNEKG